MIISSVFEVCRYYRFNFLLFRMGVQGAFQIFTKFVGQGAMLGGALYYAAKEYGVFKVGREDLLKESYRHLKQTFDIRKVCLV